MCAGFSPPVNSKVSQPLLKVTPIGGGCRGGEVTDHPGVSQRVPGI